MITAIVTSDTHLGTYYARFRPDTLELRRRQLQDGFRQVVDAAIARKVDLFLHAGDLYDTPTPRNVDRTFVAQQFQRLRDADIAVFCIAGNHDSPRSYGYEGGIVPLKELHEVNAVHLFSDREKWMPHSFCIQGMRVGIRGLSSDFGLLPDTCPLENLTASAERCGDIDLVLLHYGVEKWGDYPGEPCLTLANLDQLHADAICVGHLHKRNCTTLPGGATLLNPGATEHIRFGEEHLECGYWVLHCDPGNTKAEYQQIRTQLMKTHEIQVGTQNESEVASDSEASSDAGGLFNTLHTTILQAIEAASHKDQLLRVRLSGRINRRAFPHLDLATLTDYGRRSNLHFQLETDDLSVYDLLEGWHIEVGFNFDVRAELQNVVQSLSPAYAESPTLQEINLEAGRAIDDAFLRLSGASH